MSPIDDQRTRGKPVLAQLFRLWEEHASRYNGVLYRAALVKNGEAWQSAVVWLCPRKKSDERNEDYRADYNNLLIVRGSFSLAEARAVLERIVEPGLMNFPESPSVPTTADLDADMIRRRGSQDRRYPLLYAAYEYQLQTHRAGEQANAPRGLACGLGLPLYPYAYAAIEHELGVRVANQGTPEIVALAPDYRARVKKVRLSMTGAAVEIETPEGDDTQIVGKVYHENFARVPNGRKRSRAIGAPASTSGITTPTRISVVSGFRTTRARKLRRVKGTSRTSSRVGNPKPWNSRKECPTSGRWPLLSPLLRIQGAAVCSSASPTAPKSSAASWKSWQTGSPISCMRTANRLPLSRPVP
jgi:hypothetical protein